MRTRIHARLLHKRANERTNKSSSSSSGHAKKPVEFCMIVSRVVSAPSNVKMHNARARATIKRIIARTEDKEEEEEEEEEDSASRRRFLSPF